MAGLSQLNRAILGTIEHSALSREEKDDIRHNLSGFRYILEDVSQRQTEWREADRNGSEPKPKRPKKAKKAFSGVGEQS